MMLDYKDFRPGYRVWTLNDNTWSSALSPRSTEAEAIALGESLYSSNTIEDYTVLPCGYRPTGYSIPA